MILCLINFSRDFSSKRQSFHDIRNSVNPKSLENTTYRTRFSRFESRRTGQYLRIAARRTSSGRAVHAYGKLGRRKRIIGATPFHVGRLPIDSTNWIRGDARRRSERVTEIYAALACTQVTIPVRVYCTRVYNAIKSRGSLAREMNAAERTYDKRPVNLFIAFVVGRSRTTVAGCRKTNRKKSRPSERLENFRFRRAPPTICSLCTTERGKKRINALKISFCRPRTIFALRVFRLKRER